MHGYRHSTIDASVALRFDTLELRSQLLEIITDCIDDPGVFIDNLLHLLFNLLFLVIQSSPLQLFRKLEDLLVPIVHLLEEALGKRYYSHELIEGTWGLFLGHELVAGESAEFRQSVKHFC